MREKKPSPYVEVIQNYFYKNEEGNFCSGKPELNVLFKVSNTLENIWDYRRQKKIRFSKEEIEYVIERVCFGLRDIKEIK